MSFRWDASARRTAPPGRACCTPRMARCETPVFMPVGTAGDGEGDDGRCGARDRRAHRARQHLPPHAPARRRARRIARRAAPHDGLARPDPDRLRRLPGDVARQAAQARRGRRHLPQPSRRHRRTASRPSARPQIQHLLDATITMALDECTPFPATPERGARLDGALDALGRALRAQAFVDRAGYALFGIVQGSIYPDLRAALRRGAAGDRVRGLRGRRPRGRRGAGGDVRRAGCHRAAPAGRPAALPHGRRHAGRHHRRRARAASTCSTA